MNDPYADFIAAKVILSAPTGFAAAELSPVLFPHQADSVRWACRRGRALVAKSFGLGKTLEQCEVARQVVARTNRPVLVVCPLAVRHQFMREDGPRIGVEWTYVRTTTNAEVSIAGGHLYLITNYERIRDGQVDPRAFEPAMVSLDEGSVLRSLGSKTVDVFNTVFADVPYRYVYTATPAPNRYSELLQYADFLDIMDRGQALTRWFQRDSSKAGNLTVHPQHAESFWLWMSSWAFFLHAPSDLGYSDDGYDLPEIEVHWHRVPVDHTRAWSQLDSRGQSQLMLAAATGVKQAAAEKRATLPARLAKACKIIANDDPAAHWLVWHHLEAERKAIEGEIPGVVTVYGSQSLDAKEAAILDFAHGRTRILATKPEIAGSGCNFQRHCSRNIFLGLDYGFQDFIQAIHRTHRYQQRETVHVHIIHAESEDAVADTMRRKWAQHNRLVAQMRALIREHGLSRAAIEDSLHRRIGVQRQEVIGSLFRAIHNDCVAEVREMATNSVGMILTSVPFGNHYEYTDQYEDFGHNPTDADYHRQMDFLLPELLRVLKPGRVAAIHVKDRILYGHQTDSGFMEVGPFSDETVTAFRKHGWLYEGRRTIITDVVRENASTYRLGWTEMCRDSTKMGCGLPEYLLLFRKPPTSTDNARADEPVNREKLDYTRARWQIDAAAFWRSTGNVHLSPHELYDYEQHVARLEAKDSTGNLPSSFCAEPARSWHPHVWDDVVYMRTLNSEQARKREQNHICPLPLDIVDRALRLYSAPADIILDPFAGLHTVPYCAIQMGRRGWGVELNARYWDAGIRYCQAAERDKTAPTLFDLAEVAS